ncbi:CAP domain-containing protein [Kangiella aquimarina]|uniref:CAP domain-containing protein n=1 Tax=Kangiella aquimarina TaxID=261965 RepID=A0ABZ0X224_9GAMM|nr:CAP domain-containing protein [Kangiella aquimarina]WQG84637.1 CAP domain-containing protein [Kangiella aquimarina]
MRKTSLLCFLTIIFQFSVKAAEDFDCGLNEKAKELALMIINHKDQKRVSLSCSPILAKVAALKAREMAETGRVSHEGPGGSPNARLIEAGYQLDLPPGVVGTNFVESVMGGSPHAEEVLDYFSSSYVHRIHIFGEHPFYLEQTEIGVGYAKEWFSPHVDYWVVYIAKPKNQSSSVNATK